MLSVEALGATAGTVLTQIKVIELFNAWTLSSYLEETVFR